MNVSEGTRKSNRKDKIGLTMQRIVLKHSFELRGSPVYFFCCFLYFWCHIYLHVFFQEFYRFRSQIQVFEVIFIYDVRQGLLILSLMSGSSLPLSISSSFPLSFLCHLVCIGLLVVFSISDNLKHHSLLLILLLVVCIASSGILQVMFLNLSASEMEQCFLFP